MPIADVEALMDRGDLPRVEDWKRAMFNYKQSSIALGVLDEPTRDSSVLNSPYAPPYPPGSAPVAQNTASSLQPKHPPRLDPPPRTPSPTHLPKGILLAADVVSFHYEMEEYWFRIDATFQPYDPANPNSIPPAKQLVLFRVYNDFYDFQVNLLNTFPREAGREPPAERILPYMPGPAQQVDDQITASRRAELDEYLHKLCELNHAGAKYILEHDVVREFLALKPGDVEHESDPRVDDIEVLYGYDEYTNGHSAAADEYENEVRDTLGNMSISKREDDQRSEGSDYDEEGYLPPSQSTEPPPHRPGESLSGMSLRHQVHSQNHQRTGSTLSSRPAPSPGVGRGVSPYHHHISPSQASSALPGHSPGQSRSYSPSGRSPLEDSRTGEYSNRWPDNNSASSPSSPHSKSSSIAPSSRSRSHSNATSNLNNPPISAANSQTAFVKIKIFDRVTDDLIALRVHPRVSHGELMDKVQARLGGEVMHLRYRDSLNNEFVGLDNDDELSDWMESTDKHVLYAD
jgi:bud emergence protein 1